MDQPLPTLGADAAGPGKAPSGRPLRREPVLRGRLREATRVMLFGLRSAAFAIWTIPLAAASHARKRRGTSELILHLGQHKTGSTTIQSVILQRRAELAASGVHVVRLGQWTHGAHHRLVRWLGGKASGLVTQRLLRAEIGQAAEDRFLISSEAALGVIRHGRGEQLVDALLRSGADRVHLLLYLRSPFALANAHFSQQTSWFELGGAKFTDFLRTYRVGHPLDRLLHLAQRKEVVLTVRPYDAAVRQSVVQDFFNTLGVLPLGTTEPRLNKSFGPIGLEAMRAMCVETRPLARSARIRLCRRLRRIAAAVPERPFWGFDEEHERLLDVADSHVDAFAKAVWGKGWREVIGEERRPLNVFNSEDPQQMELYEATIGAMREAKAAENIP